MQRFGRLIVWQRAHELTLDIYRETSRLPAIERYGLVAQMRSAAVSIESNSAEGCGRSTRRDLARFLHIASGSAYELECQLRIARDLGYLDIDITRRLSGKRREVKQMLVALISSVRAHDAADSLQRRGPGLQR
jgi:four helix bundle protein